MIGWRSDGATRGKLLTLDTKTASIVDRDPAMPGIQHIGLLGEKPRSLEVWGENTLFVQSAL